MHSISLKRLSVLHNLEKQPLRTGEVTPDVSDQLDIAVRWAFRISFALLVLFFLMMIGMIAYGAGEIITAYGSQMGSP